MIEKLNRHFGSALAMSVGYRIAERGCCLDWGLVQVEKTRLRPNTVG